MNGKITWLLTGCLAVALLASAQAQQAVPMDRNTESHPSLEKANELIGAKVINDKQENLGTIEDIVLTPDRTAVSYVALSHGGLWGWGGKLFAVPWSQFEVKTANNTLILSDITPADLENAKGFDKSHWPATANENWLGRTMSGSAKPPAMRMSRHEGMTNTREHMKARSDRSDSPGVGALPTAMALKYRKLSELVGLTIKNEQGEELGELENLVIDVHQGQVAYAILSMRSGFLDLHKELAAVPWSSFDILPRLGTARLNADKETLQAIAFDQNKFPDLADAQYSRQLYQRFNATPYWETLGFIPGREMTRPESSAWKPDSKYNALYNPNATETIHGTIASVGTFRLEGTTVEGLRLRIKTNDGKIVTVHAGPRPYVDSQKIGFHYGDRVAVTGSPAKMGWRDVIVASQIQTGDKTLVLRTKEGTPRWNTEDFKNAQ